MVSISEDGSGRITGVYLPTQNLPCMDASSTDALDYAAEQISEYLSGSRTEFELDICYDATGFAGDVLEAIRAIPYGEVRTYADLAKEIGHPGVARAVGNVCTNNPLPVIIPCHRVIPASGGYGSYAGGTNMKRRLLNLEGVHL